MIFTLKKKMIKISKTYQLIKSLHSNLYFKQPMPRETEDTVQVNFNFFAIKEY